MILKGGRLMEELAQVVEKRGENVLVRVIRNSACSKCDKDCGMAGTSHETDEIDVEVSNTMGAEEGNYVKLELGKKTLVLASLIVYLFPIISLIGGYFLTNFSLATLGYGTGEITGILGSLTFFFLSFLLIRIMNFRLKVMGTFQPEMIEVLE